MPNIDIRREHGRSLESAKEAVDETAKALSQRFSVSTEWDGDTLRFQRGGLSGQIEVTQAEVHVTVELGLLFGAMKPMIEGEIQRRLDESFS
jgi:putative polyhydroxyalkanoate system protein